MSEPSESPKSRRNPRFSFPEGLKVRWLLGLFAWILWGGSLLPPFSPPAAAIPREIRYGLTDHPPVFVRTPTGEASGFLPDLLREIARRKGWQIRFVFAEGNELVRMLQAGELDLLNMVPTPRLEKLFDFGKEPVFSTWYTFYTLPNRGVLSFQDLKGRKVAIQRGFYALVELKEILRQTRTDAKVVEYPTQGEAFRALLERRVDACAAEQLTSLGDREKLALRRSPLVFAPARIFFGTTKGRHSDLLRELDEEIRLLREIPGSPYDRLRSRWFYDENLTFFPRWGVALILGGALVILLLGTLAIQWYRKERRLRRQERLLARSLTFEKALAECARDLLSQETPDTLQRLCDRLRDAAGADSVVLCRWEEPQGDGPPRPSLWIVADRCDGEIPSPLPSSQGPDPPRSGEERSRPLRIPLDASGGHLEVRLPRDPQVLLTPEMEAFLAAGAHLLDAFLLRRDTEQQLLRQAHTDPLTEAANRRAFFEAAEREFHRSRRHGSPLSLALLDVDLFKNVNDRYGHEAGDVALRLVARAVGKGLRREDLLGRVGGEEFAVLLPETGLEEALAVAERIRATVGDVQVPSEYPCLFGEEERCLSVSLGVASLRPEDPGVDSLYRRADRGLYRAKRQGRNRVAADPGPPSGDPSGALLGPPRP